MRSTFTFGFDLLHLALVWRSFTDFLLSITFLTSPTKILATLFSPTSLSPLLSSRIATHDLLPQISLLSFTRALYSLAGALVMSEKDKVWVLGVGVVSVLGHVGKVWWQGRDVDMVGVRNDAAYWSSMKIHCTESIVLSLILLRAMAV